MVCGNSLQQPWDSNIPSNPLHNWGKTGSLSCDCSHENAVPRHTNAFLFANPPCPLTSGSGSYITFGIGLSLYSPPSLISSRPSSRPQPLTDSNYGILRYPSWFSINHLDQWFGPTAISFEASPSIPADPTCSPIVERLCAHSTLTEFVPNVCYRPGGSTAQQTNGIGFHADFRGLFHCRNADSNMV